MTSPLEDGDFAGSIFVFGFALYSTDKISTSEHDVKIRLTDIPATGLTVEEVIPPEALNERLKIGNDQGFSFTEGLAVSLKVFKTPNGAETKGVVSTRYRQPCARCADGVERELSLNTNYILQQRPEMRRGHEAEEYEDDIGITYYDGEHIDLDDLIHETIILSLSTYWHPEEDATGKCGFCKRDVHAPVKVKPSAQGTSLSDLLKKAGVE